MSKLLFSEVTGYLLILAEHRPITSAPAKVLFTFQICCFLSMRERLESKIEARFCAVDSPVAIRKAERDVSVNLSWQI